MREKGATKKNSANLFPAAFSPPPATVAFLRDLQRKPEAVSHTEKTRLVTNYLDQLTSLQCQLFLACSLKVKQGTGI